MAKDLPYFKFNVSEWNDGDITICSLEAQGLFINLCSLYWSQEGELSITKCKRRFKECNTTVWDELTCEGIIKVDGDNIFISFLDEQFRERKKLSTTNSNNVRKRWEKEHKNTTVLRTNNNGKPSVYNIEEKREEERDTVTHGKGKLYITVRRVFANDPIHKIFDLSAYFKHTQQLDTMNEKGWVYFSEFIDANAGKIFNEPDHLYNSFKNFCIAYRPAPVVEKFKEEAFNKTLWTLEAWEQQYDWQLKSNNEFRKHFGYAEL